MRELHAFLTYKSLRVSTVTKLKIVEYPIGLMVIQRIVIVQHSLLRN